MQPAKLKIKNLPLISIPSTWSRINRHFRKTWALPRGAWSQLFACLCKARPLWHPQPLFKKKKSFMDYSKINFFLSVSLLISCSNKEPGLQMKTTLMSAIQKVAQNYIWNFMTLINPFHFCLFNMIQFFIKEWLTWTLKTGKAFSAGLTILQVTKNEK